MPPHTRDRSLPRRLRQIPSERLWPFLHQAGMSRRALSDLLSKRYGNHPDSWERRLYSISRGEQKTVGFDMADRILVALDRVDAWHSELADLYEPRSKKKT